MGRRGVEVAHDLPDAGGQRRRVRPADHVAHRRSDEGHFPVGARDRHRIVPHRRRIVVERRLVHVLHHADDPDPLVAGRRRQTAGPETLAQRRFPWPVGPRERPRHDGDRRPPGVEAVELATFEQRRAHRLEVAGRHLFPREHRLDAVRAVPPFDVVVRQCRVAGQGHGGRRRRAGDPGQTAQAFEHLPMEDQPRCRGHVDAAGKGHSERERVGRIEPRVDRGQPLERAHRQPRPNQQGDREGDLCDHQSPARELAVPAVSGAARARREVGRRPDRARAPRREQAAEQTAHDRHGEPKEQHRPVDRDLVQAREIPGGVAHERPHRQPCDRQRRRTAGQPEQHALEKKRDGQSTAVGAQGEPDGPLVGTRLGAHKEEVGDVDAGNQQQDADGAQQEPQRRPYVAHDGLEEGDDQRPEAALRQIRRGELVRKDLGQIRHERLQLGLSLRRRDAVRQTRYALVGEVAELRPLPVEGERPP